MSTRRAPSSTPTVLTRASSRAWRWLLVACLAAVCAWPVVAAAEGSPKVCKGPLEPSVVGGCKLDSAGCCDATGRLLYCAGADLYCIDCAGTFPACGWASSGPGSSAGTYDCGTTGGADPSGMHPLSCSACPAECQGGAAACSAKCSGLCGKCEGKGALCLDDGACYVPQCGQQTCGVDPNGFPCGVCPSGTACEPGLSQCLPVPQACLPSDQPGCAGCMCESCVCTKHPFCCTLAWDAFCAEACETECGQSCAPCPAKPTCDGLGCGNFCGVDCGGCKDGQVCHQYQCCQPTCEGKTCGSDGCGGKCGSCGEWDACIDGQCEKCVPDCEGMACGSDGCGGECGQCDKGLICIGNACMTGVCAGQCGGGPVKNESGQDCYCDDACVDYGDCCEGVCESCPGNKGCCETTCDGTSCGDDGCGGKCPCNKGTLCKDGTCVACLPQCAGKACGDDGCGGDCAECPAHFACKEGQCVANGCDGVQAEGCCDGQTLKVCNGGQVTQQACAPPGGCGWHPGNQHYDCGTTGEADPSGKLVKACPGSCEPKCLGLECGPDGCGGECGGCFGGKQCQDGQCACVPGDERVCCGSALCTLDSCGQNAQFLQSCANGCEAAACRPTCVPQCKTPGCGPDGCGGTCGACASGVACSAGVCKPDASGDTAGSSGGCDAGATGPGARGGGLLLLLSVLLMGAVRRRSNRSSWWVMGALVALLVVAGCGNQTQPIDATVPTDVAADVEDVPDVCELMDVVEPDASDVEPDVPDLSDLPDLADASDAETDVTAEIDDDVDAGQDTADLPEPATYDCNALPPGPFQLEAVPGAVASEDLAFDHLGNLVGSNNTALYRTKAGGKGKLWVPNVDQRAGMRFLPNGKLAVCDDKLGRILLFDQDGSQTVLVQGLLYPNGITVDLKGYIYVTEHDAGRVLRIDPYSGDYTVLTNAIQNPNGIIFDPEFKYLYIGSFATGSIYRLAVSPTGVPGKLIVWSNPTGGDGLLDGIGVDVCGNVYVCEYGNADIWRIPPQGGPGVRIVDADPGATYLPNMQWGTGGGWDPYSLYLPDGWKIGLWRVRVGVPTAPRAFP
ncbi:MAG: SMP-30/gluconolactonase/LRE family protein [Myxococcota bacterium]